MNGRSELALEAIKISKRFGELAALDNVSLKLRRGSLHALLGENGAGKSTLVKCIMGYYRPDEGELLVNGRQQSITNPRDAKQIGIGMVYQHFTLVPNMTVAENLVLAQPMLPAVIDWDSEVARLEKKMASMPFKVSLHASVNDLAAGEKQKVEIIKQLMLDAEVLILDEPTSVLTPTEADEVLGQLQRLTRQRQLTVLIITHKFREVMTYADDVTVLRRGKYIGTCAVPDVNPHILANMMVGSETVSQPIHREAAEIGGTALEVRGLEVEDDGGRKMLQGLSLCVRSGEIVGIAGVSGNGQRELLETLAGQRRRLSGEVEAFGEAYDATRADMRKFKFYCLPEEPLRNACVPAMSVADNLALRRFDQAPNTMAKWFLNRSAIRRAAVELIGRFRVKTPSPENPIANLSGGNVQRAVLARELTENARILAIANPCFGLDFGAVADIHQQIMAARNQGAAVLLISEDLDEIIELSDRILVMSGGRIVYETKPADVNLTVIGQYMAGH